MCPSQHYISVVVASLELAPSSVSAKPSAVVSLFRFPPLSPLKSFPTKPLFRDCSDLPRLIRWDDYEELPQRENIAPLKSSVMVRGRQRCVSCSTALPRLTQRLMCLSVFMESKWQEEMISSLYSDAITAVISHSALLKQSAMRGNAVQEAYIFTYCS